MGAIRSAHIKTVKNGGNQQRLIFPSIPSHRALTQLGQDICLFAIRTRGADFDSNIFLQFLVESEPYSRIRSVAELMYYSISLVQAIIDMDWMIAAGLITTDILYFINIFVLDIFC